MKFKSQPFPALHPYRKVLFDPCVTSGSKVMLHEARDPNFTTGFDELLGLAHGSPKGEGIKLIRAPMNEVVPMLISTGAVFDAIVSAPPPGETVPQKGLPPPNTKAAAKVSVGRKLFLMAAEAVAPVEEPQIDLGYAVFLVTNVLLSSFGEALLVVGPESLKLIEKDALYSRVWAQNRVRGDDLTELYIARDHRPIPGVGNEILAGRHAIKGQTLQALTLSPSSVHKFTIVRDEIMRRASLQGDDFNLFLENNLLRVKFNPYAFEHNQKVRALALEMDLVRNKSLVDLAVLRDTRDKLRGYLKNPLLKVPPGLVTAFEDVCKQMQTLTAPFTRPSAVQRVAWLDEQNGIECIRPFGLFEPGKTYPIHTRVIQGRKTEMRHRPGHKQPEEVLVTGQEVLVHVQTEGWGHCFTQYPVTEDMEEFGSYLPDHRHTLSELVQNFKMPEVPDIAEADAATYLKFVDRLRKLETT